MVLRVTNLSKSTCLGTNIKVADSPRERMVGLLNTTCLERESGLLIFPTQAVHTFGMKYPIDIIFLDRKKKVVGLSIALRPFRLTPFFWRAECAIELPVSTIERSGTEIGDYVAWEETAAEGSC